MHDGLTWIHWWVGQFFGINNNFIDPRSGKSSSAVLESSQMKMYLIRWNPKHIMNSSGYIYIYIYTGYRHKLVLQAFEGIIFTKALCWRSLIWSICLWPAFMRAKRLVSCRSRPDDPRPSHSCVQSLSSYDCRAWGLLGEKHGEAAGWGSEIGSKQCIPTLNTNHVFFRSLVLLIRLIMYFLTIFRESVLLIGAVCQLACIQNVVLEAAALLASSSSSLLEVCVRSLLLWYATVQLLRGSVALCGKEIGKKVTEEVETESRSRGRKASLVACSQHISLCLQCKFMQVFLFLPTCFRIWGHPEFFPPWCLVVSESCCSSSSPSIHAGQCSTGQDSEFRLSPVFGRVDADSSALDTWCATCGRVGWGPVRSNDILRSILLSRTLSGASSQMQPRCSNSFVDLRTGCGLFWNFEKPVPWRSVKATASDIFLCI